MSETDTSSITKFSSDSLDAKVMLKRVFGVAKILAVACYRHDIEEKIAKNYGKNPHPDVLQYCENDQYTPTT